MSNANPSNLDAKTKKRIAITFAACVAFMILVILLFLNKMLQPRILSKQELQVNGAIVLEPARIIRPLNLVDNKGNTFTLENLKGKWSLLYFGFTHCPDICPTTLMRMNELLNGLEPEIAAKTQIIMVTADPARDTPEILDTYVNHFNKNFIGVTGQFLDVKRFAGDVTVAFNKVLLDNGDYTIDHTGNLILMNPLGHYHGFFKPPFDLAKMKLTYQSIVSSSPL